MAPGANLPVETAATAEAQELVPEAEVFPTPRSQLKMRTRPGASTVAS
jgi:hypothetical protein